jgi:hypothetical protein
MILSNFVTNADVSAKSTTVRLIWLRMGYQNARPLVSHSLVLKHLAKRQSTERKKARRTGLFETLKTRVKLFNRH